MTCDKHRQTITFDGDVCPACEEVAVLEREVDKLTRHLDDELDETHYLRQRVEAGR